MEMFPKKMQKSSTGNGDGPEKQMKTIRDSVREVS